MYCMGCDKEIDDLCADGYDSAHETVKEIRWMIRHHREQAP